ncbi:MAG: thioredoxin [Eubacteriales bacterium]|nr:thioredoxin [Eubacteriales bacterium]
MSISDNGKGDTNMKEMLEELRGEIFAQGGAAAKNTESFFKNKQKYIVFLSFSDAKSRAYVTKGIGNSVETAWKSAADLMKKKVKDVNIKPIWIKADIVTDVKGYSYANFIKYISGIKINYFREGIALDNLFNIAFLEQEVNANAFIWETKDSGRNQKQMVWKNINFYLKKNLGEIRNIDQSAITNVYTFRTIGFFHDGTKCYLLHNDGLNIGRRHIEETDAPLLQEIIERSSNFLADQVDETGKFCYGYFSCFDKTVPGYNILRHASTAYSMIEAYECNKDLKLKNSIQRSLEYLLKEGIRTFEEHEEAGKSAFVIERLKDDDSEIKLGANAAAILAFTKYAKVFNDDTYIPAAQALAEGIRFFQDKQDGSFVHILNVPDLSVREKHRIIYYDGEAAFALMRLYDIDRDERWLEAVEKAFEYFISNNYWKHGDHWLSYCSYELMKYRPEQKYIAFNLKNADGILDFCLRRETTYPTLLELLMATYCMIEKMKNDALFLEMLESFDCKKLINAIEHRVVHQLNGLFFPEVAMYFKAPEKIVWSFYIRHHSFRTRIDDNEHNISGYCSYLHNISMA